MKYEKMNHGTVMGDLEGAENGNNCPDRLRTK